MKYSTGLLISFLLLLTQSHAQQRFDSTWTSLFNGTDLTGWDTYLGPPQDSAGNRLTAEPIGLNNDPDGVFRVLKEDGKSVICISGKGLGGLITTTEFDNYHLQLRFKWGRWLQRGRRKRDSGLLYHSVGNLGADFGAWMRSQEFQIEEGNCGDYWGCAGGMATIPAIKKSDSEYVYDPQAHRFTFSADSATGRHCKKSIDAEKKSGQWNTLDLYCYGDTSVHVVNGKPVMILYKNSQRDGEGQLPLTRGKIQLQSEGAEIFYTDIRIEPITRIPALAPKDR